MNALERLANTAANFIWSLNAPRDISAEQKAAVKIVAHRGVHGPEVCENSRESFALAVQNNIWGVEFDVRFTADGVPVIHHDPDCRRLYSCPAVIEETPYTDLQRLVPQIPSLEEIVQKYGGKLHLLIEIKERVTPAQNAKLADVLRPLKPLNDYHLLCLKPDYLEGVAFAPKTAFMAVGWANMAQTIAAALHLGHGAVSGPFLLLTAARLKTCKERGLITGTGFIETKGALYREINRGIDWIFTNHPLRLKAYLA